MPRIAETRAPAEPSSPEQKDRYLRILRAAALIGSEHDLEHVQMHDVARSAGVAIATLYRYFPSKVHLFAAIMREQVVRIEQLARGPAAGQQPRDAVADLLIDLSRLMRERPQLSLSMIQANNLAQTLPGSGSALIDQTFERLILRTAGIDEPSVDERRRGRLVMQCWFGVLMSVLNGHSSEDDARADIRRACELLLP